MIKTNLLKAKQAEKGVNNKSIANKIGISEQQLSKILNNKIRLDVNRAVEIANAIGISQKEFCDIFLDNSFTS